jgi:uncharacterized DUF497 family protein
MDNVYTLSMDVLYRYEGLEFVWDAQKAASNFAKHGIRFERACEVFVDPLLQLRDAGVEDEARDAVSELRSRASCSSSSILSARMR